MENIVGGLNKHIEQKRRELNIDAKGHLVLCHTIETNTTFKAYKTYKSTIWFVQGKNRQEILSESYTDKINSSNKEKIVREVSVLLSAAIFDWIGSIGYNNVIKGVYNGDAV